jgi:hypothetical protein
MSDNNENSHAELAVQALAQADGATFSKNIHQGLYDRAADSLAIKKVEAAQNIFTQNDHYPETVEEIPEVDPHSADVIGTIGQDATEEDLEDENSTSAA